jgi:hypothetical protein
VSRKARALPKKRKRRVSAAPRTARKPSAGAAKAAKENTTEIVFSYGEIDFLRKITKKEFEGTTPRERRARLSLRDKLLEINFNLPAAGAGGLIVLELARAEVDFLQRITKEVYSFITAEERRARLILREKILIAVEKVTGKRVQPEEVSE